AAAHAAKPMGLKKLHRILRGRYPLAVGLGLICGILGAVGGFLTQRPMYESVAMIDVKPSILRPGENGDQPMANYQVFVKSQMGLLQSRDLVLHALDKPEWRALGKPNGDEGLLVFMKNYDVDNTPPSGLIKVSVMDRDPKAAQVGAQCITNAFN